tara:strand:+ start:464 stop:802 length:339 start_codon:yes stop_codon:yes gene_type:complete
MITAAGRMLMKFGRGALRQTKHLSPWKRATKSANKKVVATQKIGGKELRPWSKKVFGNKGWLRSAGLSATKTRQGLYGYSRATKHVAKHKKLYGAGVTGAAAWDFLPGKDNE